MQFFHGSSAEPFERFDLSHALEGDGKVKFGWGVYVTQKYSTAAHYAFNKHRPENRDFYVYTVEIPDRTKDNCLSLLKGVPVTPSIVERVERKLGEPVPAEAREEGIPFRKWLANRLSGNVGPVKKMTDKATVAGEKAASEFLSTIGVELIEWPYNWQKPEAEKVAAFCKVVDEWGVFGNFAPTPVVVDGVTFDCTEKLFQVMKFADTDSRRTIYSQKGQPIKMKAKHQEKVGTVRQDWGYIFIDAMRFCLVQKYAQSEAFRKELERSKGLFIVEQEANPRRPAGAWSAKLSEDGTVWRGPNIMGRLLMELRDKGTLPYSLPEEVMRFKDLC